MAQPTDPPANDPEKRRKPSLAQTDVPSVSLDEALRIARGIADLGKIPSAPIQVAAAIGIKPTTGDFRTLCGASIAYGLTDGGYAADTIRLTDLGRQIVAPTEEGAELAGRREAVLRPRVTRLFLERFNGTKWPRPDIAENVIETMGVPHEQAARAAGRILQDAQSVGFIVQINGDPFVDLGAPAASASVLPDPPGGGMVGVATPAQSQASTELPAVESSPPGAEAAATAVQPPHENRRVFITHGKDTAIVAQIKEILRFGDFEPVVAIENQTAAKPLPDKVMDDMRSCGAGIVHVGPELRLLDPEGNEHQMLNPNVLIEIGAAMALYGRRFILLVEEGTSVPSNLQGLYQVRYTGGGLDHGATMNLLKAFNTFKNELGSAAA